MRKMRKYIAATLACSLLLSLSGQAESVDAAKKKPYLNKKKLTLSVGKKITLKVKGTKKKIQWKSKNKKIATVSKKGVVKVKKKGTTYIQAKVKKTSYILRCKVVVKGVSPQKANPDTETYVPIN
nr:Ig-like domain-containing protein [Eubacterium sp.]